ncbi:MAG: DUF4830 domain-containing protein [Oscillospiraceae bacterium]
MFVLTMKLDKKKAAFIVVMAALVLIGIILLVGAYSRGAAADSGQVSKVKSEKNRVAYLAQYGWEVESPAVSSETVIIPRSFSEVFESYNQLQLQQGFDLSRYCGMEVEKYTYRVTNGPDGDEVLAQLFVYKGQVIGGDVHSTALDGFMRGIRES